MSIQITDQTYQAFAASEANQLTTEVQERTLLQQYCWMEATKKYHRDNEHKMT